MVGFILDIVPIKIKKLKKKFQLEEIKMNKKLKASSKVGKKIVDKRNKFQID